MTEREELIYMQGARAARWQLLGALLREMGYGADDELNDDERERYSRAALAYERELTVAKLRSLCDEFGDNDWPDNLHLRDVLEKHLENHLEEARLRAGRQA